MRANAAIVGFATLIACYRTDKVSGAESTAQSSATLLVSVVGPGAVGSPSFTAPCRGTCAVSVSSAGSIHLEALADAGAAFAGWSGPCAGTATCDLTIPESGAAVVAAFEIPRPMLEGSITGSGAVQSDPKGIYCPGQCSATFDPGAV